MVAWTLDKNDVMIPSSEMAKQLLREKQWDILIKAIGTNPRQMLDYYGIKKGSEAERQIIPKIVTAILKGKTTT